ncbi:MAG: hypothetical protein ACREC5_08305, partial [Thermoplasmata archaeon]
GEWPIDPGLMARFRRAGAEIRWSELGTPPGGDGPAGRALIARHAVYDDESARIEERLGPSRRAIRAESCPVGALVLLLEIDRAGRLPSLAPIPSDADPSFPGGAIEAWWGAAGEGPSLPLRQLVALARFALK